jgi:amidase
MTTPTGLMEAFHEYERALGANDLAALDRLFAPGPETLRGDADGLLVGHDAISAFRNARGGAPARRIVATHVQALDDDHALIVAVTELLAGGRGLQTQLWERTGGEWSVAAAHVSTPPPALDPRTWRVVGDPLLPALGDGVLGGESVAVKDLYAVAGHRIGAGNPAWLKQAPVEPDHAWVVERLLAAGASVRGITRTDEFAYSLAGANSHYGAPPNPRAPYRLPGGSSSGSASAVSLGHATIGLGTDTGGSTRVPAAYQGLFGIRTTHGAVPVDGLLALAPSFDAVGWLTRDPTLLAGVGQVLLPPSAPGTSDELVVSNELLGLAQPDVAAAVAGFLARLPHREVEWDLTALPEWLEAFQTLQAAEAWRSHGDWLGPRMHTLGPGVRRRFERGRDLSESEVVAARNRVAEARALIRDAVGEQILVVPSAASVAPRDAASAELARNRTMQLTCLAGLGGLPAVSLPVSTPDGLPAGVCLVAAPGRDLDLLRLVNQLPSTTTGQE